MNTKDDYKENQLVAIFKEKTGWNLARVKFLAAIILSMLKLQTVVFTKLAQGFGGHAKKTSKLRRIQRFFAEFNLSPGLIAKLVFSL